MSTHLFKAKDAETKKWVEGYLWSERTIGVTSPCGNVDEVVIEPDMMRHLLVGPGSKKTTPV